MVTKQDSAHTLSELSYQQNYEYNQSSIEHITLCSLLVECWLSDTALHAVAELVLCTACKNPR